jgi:hypothetical protein
VILVPGQLGLATATLDLVSRYLGVAFLLSILKTEILILLLKDDA